jgi:hypothetical protein
MTLETGNPEITDLRDMVTAAHKEIDMAVAFHEVWKPAAYDRDLHARMGKSYATHAFRITAIALRREMLLALARLWDTYKYEPTIRMTWIAHTLRDDRILDALAAERVSSAGLPEAFDDMRADLAKRACEVVQLVRKYLEGGSRKAVLDKLLTLRHEELAHRRVAPSEATGANATDEEIEEFYQDNLSLVRNLLTLVNATAYDPEEHARVVRHYAGHFWAGVRGEQTEGHPNRRPQGG